MSKSLRFRPRVWPLEPAPDYAQALSALAGRRGLAALDSAAGEPGDWSLIGFDPLQTASPAPRSLVELRSLLSALELMPGDALPGPFHGGFLGALSYELGVHGEGQALPRAAFETPAIAGGLYTDFIVWEHALGRAWLVLGDEPGDDREPLDARRAALLELLAQGPPERQRPRPTGPLVRHVASAEHQVRIAALRAAIGRGDLYQANLAHRFTRRVRGEPTDIYRRLRRFHPAPYMGYLEWDGGALLSGSPELLVSFDGRTARTRPIKGTIERGSTPDEDQRNQRRLLASAKDLAELAMIVDLERNDLGRVARTGSVRVEGLPTLQSFASVHHLMADVACTTRRDVDAVALLCALFPGGSITGAPKLASMEQIAALEGEGRGFFTGSLGFIDCRGQAAFNILIRSLVWRALDAPAEPGTGAGEVSFHVGGGITWGSDGAAEERETLHKGTALAAALDDPDLLVPAGLASELASADALPASPGD